MRQAFHPPDDHHADCVHQVSRGWRAPRGASYITSGHHFRTRQIPPTDLRLGPEEPPFRWSQRRRSTSLDRPVAETELFARLAIHTALRSGGECSPADRELEKAMRAVTWQGKRNVSVETMPDPIRHKADDAIIEVTSTAICGSDLHLYEVLGPFMDAGDILGHETMGRVVEVGVSPRAVSTAVPTFPVAPMTAILMFTPGAGRWLIRRRCGSRVGPRSRDGLHSRRPRRRSTGARARGTEWPGRVARS